MDKIVLKALAKVNLGLDVLRRREDGYHDLKMIMQTIDLYDTVELEKTETPGITVRTNLADLPVNQDNLVYKAARLFMTETGMNEAENGVCITLEKRIPVAAGLAGGSSDAAAVFKGMNRMFEKNLSMEELMKMGKKVGADVPYCIKGGTALAEGIGELLTELPAVENCPVLLVKPDAAVSTKFVYQNLKLTEETVHPDIDGQADAIRNGDTEGMLEKMGNVLETVTIPAYPQIREIKEEMLRKGAQNAMMSGSGPTVFGIFSEKETAENALAAFEGKEGIQVALLTGFENNVD